MGQYHLTVNLDKKEFLDPHKLGDGLKLWEQINSHGGVCAALLLLLACSNGRGGGDVEEHPIVGRWAGDRIAVVGDYAEDTDLAPEHKAGSIYERCNSGEFKDITDEIVPIVEQACDVKITGTGWRDKVSTLKDNKLTLTAMRPDIVIVAGPAPSQEK